MSEPIPKFPPLPFRPRRFWDDTPTPPTWLEEKDELTLRDLVDFGEQEPVRLPTALILALTELRKARTSSGKARIVLGQEGAQKTINLSIRVRPRVLASMTEQDEVYEQIEGATTTKYVIYAHLIEQNMPRYRTLTFDDGDLVKPNDLPADTQPDDDEAWLLVSTRDLFWQNVEQTELMLEQWQVDHGIEGLPGFQVLEQAADDHTLPPSGIELPGLPTRLQVQGLVEQLAQTLSVEIQVALTQKDHVSEASHKHTPLFEDARSMARRLRSSR
ncbi:hypothetical protein [Deinococcus sp. UYEF24]